MPVAEIARECVRERKNEQVDEVEMNKRTAIVRIRLSGIDLDSNNYSIVVNAYYACG